MKKNQKMNGLNHDMNELTDVYEQISDAVQNSEREDPMDESKATVE